MHGRLRYEWMDGSFYLVLHVELAHDARRITGVEYIGFDQDTQTLRSHFMDSSGANFTYSWDLIDRTLLIWFGERDSPNFFRGELTADGSRYDGSWQWPDGQGGTGGYDATAIRVTA